MNADDLEAFVRRIDREFPRRDCLKRIIVPVGWLQRNAVGQPWPIPCSGDALYGVPIVESPLWPADSPPWGHFADGSLRPLLLAPEEGAGR